MDFSFVTDNQGSKRKQPETVPAGGGNVRPVFQIPSYREVQQSEQQKTAPPILFRPTAPAPSGPQQPSIVQPGSDPNVHGHSSIPAWSGGRPQTGPTSYPQANPATLSTPAAPAQSRQPVNALHAISSWSSGEQPGTSASHGWAPTGQGTAAQPGTSASHGRASSAQQQPPWVPQQQPHQRPTFPQQPQASSSGTLGAATHASTNAILVSRRQQGNPVLKHIRNVRWQFADVVPDYLLGQHTAALFLSLRYHLLHPDYILQRIKELQRAYRLLVVLVHVDVEDVVRALGQVTKTAVINEATLVCAWSPEECARYLETFKAYETKPATAIQERVDTDYVSRLASALTAVRGVNRTDAVALGTRFGSLSNILRGSADALGACPGIGPIKVQRLWEAFNEPFRKTLHPTGAQLPPTARTNLLAAPAADVPPSATGPQQTEPATPPSTAQVAAEPAEDGEADAGMLSGQGSGEEHDDTEHPDGDELDELLLSQMLTQHGTQGHARPTQIVDDEEDDNDAGDVEYI